MSYFDDEPVEAPVEAPEVSEAEVGEEASQTEEAPE